jgi:hypothetical protein
MTSPPAPPAPFTSWTDLIEAGKDGQKFRVRWVHRENGLWLEVEPVDPSDD